MRDPVKRLLVLALIGVAAFGVAPAPASATCSGTVDVACNEGSCDPDHCHIDICLVWFKGKCLV